MTHVKDSEGRTGGLVAPSTFALAFQAPARILARLKDALAGTEKKPKAPGTEVAIARPPSPPSPILPKFEDEDRHADVISWANRLMKISFLLAVLAPTLVSSLYFFVWASDSYVSETHLSVRLASERKQSMQGALDALKSFLPGPKVSTQDSQIVLDYVRSKPIIEDIGGAPYLDSIFAKKSIDYFSRLSPAQPLENVWKYWQSQVHATLDSRAGIVHIKVYGFTPGDAHELASKIVEAGEKLVNSVSMRSRADAVEQSRSEVTGSQAKLVEARTALLDFRNRKRIIDPARKGEEIGKMLVELEMQRIQIQNIVAGFGDSLNADAPSVRTFRNQIAQLDQQIAGMKQQLTSADSTSNALSDDLADYERLKLNEQFAEKFQQMTLLAHERTLQESQRQQFYLATVVRPTLPQSALYPERATNVLLTFLAFFVLWGICCMLLASVLDHLA